MTKQELLEKLEERNQTPILSLMIKLIKGTDENDADFKEVLADDMGEPIVDLFLDCYDEKSFLEWLAKYDWDLFANYRYAETYPAEDLTEEEKEDYLMCNYDQTVYVKSW